MQRYDRNEALLGVKAQFAINNSKVAVIGCGGLGSAVITNLACAGVESLVVIDDDLVSKSNLNRQFIHRDCDYNLPKVLSAERFILDLNPNISVTTVKERLNLCNCLGVLSDCDLIVDCSDNVLTKYTISHIGEMLNIPCIYSGLSMTNRYAGEVRLYDKTCNEFLKKYYNSITASNKPYNKGVLSCTTMIVGSLASKLAIDYLIERRLPYLNRLVVSLSSPNYSIQSFTELHNA